MGIQANSVRRIRREALRVAESADRPEWIPATDSHRVLSWEVVEPPDAGANP